MIRNGRRNEKGIQVSLECVATDSGLLTAALHEQLSGLNVGMTESGMVTGLGPRHNHEEHDAPKI